MFKKRIDDNVEEYNHFIIVLDNRIWYYFIKEDKIKSLRDIYMIYMKT